MNDDDCSLWVAKYGAAMLLFARQFAPSLADAEDIVQEATNAVLGLIDKQIVLISPGGARMPITYRQGGCSDPFFVPGSWPESKH